MAIPELELRRVEQALSEFCEQIPPDIRDKVSYHWKIRGNQITLYSRRPFWDDPNEYSDAPFARFNFDPKTHTWTLRWFDRNDRTHVYEGFEGVRDFHELLAEVNRDPTGIFLG